MWKNIVERGRAQITIWRLRIEGWIPKAANTHSKNVIIIAFIFRQRASLLRYTGVLISP